MDFSFLSHAISRTLATSGQSVHLLFAFEYFIQAAAVTCLMLKYAFAAVDAQLGGRWEGKSVALFYTELVKELLHLIVYCVFFALVFTNYGLPLHLVSAPANPATGGLRFCVLQQSSHNKYCLHNSIRLVRTFSVWANESLRSIVFVCWQRGVIRGLLAPWLAKLCATTT